MCIDLITEQSRENHRLLVDDSLLKTFKTPTMLMGCTAVTKGI